MDAFTGLVSDDLDKARATVQSDKGKELLAQAEQAWKDSQQTTAHAVELAMKDKLGQTRPSVEYSLGDGRAKSDAAEDLLAQVVGEKEDTAKLHNGERTQTFQRSRTMLLIMVVGSALVCVGFGVFISRSISKPLGLIAETAKKIAQGDVNQRIEFNSRDEVGVLAESFRGMIEAVKALVHDTGMLSEAAVEGNLSTRADASLHQGDFRKIVEGVNQTLDAVIGPLNVAARYVDRIAEGNIPDKITVEYRGDFNVLKDNLNTCIDAVNALVADAAMLSRAAVAGNLDARADVSKHQGDFRKIVQGVNDTLDAVIGPLSAAADFVDRISKGDTPPRITATYYGQFNNLKNNLNACIDAINQQAAAAQSIAAGDLSVVINVRCEADVASKSLVGITKVLSSLQAEMERLTGRVQGRQALRARNPRSVPGRLCGHREGRQ